MLIRPAAEPDLAALLRLYRQLNPAAAAPTQPEAAWAAMRAHPGLTAYVAEDDGMVVATCTLVVTPNLTNGARPYALIENVVTDAAHRQRGLGHAVLRAAITAAWQAGCYKVMLLTGSKQASTLRFYLSAGFSQTKTGFQIRRD
jgi:GNAT superfamily N-acetyltransferase